MPSPLPDVLLRMWGLPHTGTTLRFGTYEYVVATKAEDGYGQGNWWCDRCGASGDERWYCREHGADICFDCEPRGGEEDAGSVDAERVARFLAGEVREGARVVARVTGGDGRDGGASAGRIESDGIESDRIRDRGSSCPGGGCRA